MNSLSVSPGVNHPPLYSQLAARKLLERRRAQQQADSSYRYNPSLYMREKLGWTPWVGTDVAPGQHEILDAYALALRQQHERRDYEHGRLTREELTCWQPGQVVQNWISVDAGHAVGKTTLGAGMVSHFFDCFAPSIVYCFAPTAEQINDLLFKEIRTQRAGKGLPGRVLDGEPAIKYKSNHFVKGKATNNDEGKGTERAQGQHGEYLMFVLDEAEGIPKFIFDAVRSMASGGIAIVLVLRNPRTTVCPAHKIRKQENTIPFRISCVDHPNVAQDREIVPGAVRRQFVMELLPDCEVVNVHAPDDYTFELPWQPGVVYRPSLEFLWRIFGIASAKGTDDTFVPPGRYEAACAREPYDGDDPEFASVGIDAARYGNDKGTIYIRAFGEIWKDSEIIKKDSYEYYLAAKQACLKLMARGVRRISLRIDAGGGYGSCVDMVKRDADLRDGLELLTIHEIYFNEPPSAENDSKYYDIATELYAESARVLHAIKLKTPSPNLEVDLCERRYEYRIKTTGDKSKLDLKKLVAKEKFKDAYGRSPDDGDGFVLAAAPERLFVARNSFSAAVGGTAKAPAVPERKGNASSFLAKLKS